jgi:hypothetical protein
MSDRVREARSGRAQSLPDARNPALAEIAHDHDVERGDEHRHQERHRQEERSVPREERERRRDQVPRVPRDVEVELGASCTLRKAT